MRAREWTAAVGVSDHSSMPAFPRCGALLRNGQPCGRTVADGSEFCVNHIKLLETVDAQAMRQGRTPKKRALKESGLRVVAESPPEPVATTGPATVTNADPSTVRPLLAAVAAENVEQLKASLLEAAGSAVKPVWLTVECSSCGERSRVEAPVPDVRSRVSAIELLPREGLGRPATAPDRIARKADREQQPLPLSASARVSRAGCFAAVFASWAVRGAAFTAIPASSSRNLIPGSTTAERRRIRFPRS
jgi:hypothetical protein